MREESLSNKQLGLIIQHVLYQVILSINEWVMWYIDKRAIIKLDHGDNIRKDDQWCPLVLYQQLDFYRAK